MIFLLAAALMCASGVGLLRALRLGTGSLAVDVPLGATVTARAELLAVDGRRLTFKVTAHDGTDLIGEGTHERALIDLAKFEARINAKAEAKIQ